VVESYALILVFGLLVMLLIFIVLSGLYTAI
jgi:hypothetical protein